MRVTQKRATRGSQMYLQQVVNEAQHLIDGAIGPDLGLAGTDTVTWLSPLKHDSYAEYRDDSFLERLGVPLARPLREFWPARGPQWDGLGRTGRGDLLLVEAKAHVGELLSPPCMASPAPRRRIERSLKQVKRALGVSPACDWTGPCYQRATRLAHLYLLRALNKLPAYLLFVYFLNATDVRGPGTAEHWMGAIDLLESQLRLDRERVQETLGNAVVDVFIDVRDIAAAVC